MLSGGTVKIKARTRPNYTLFLAREKARDPKHSHWYALGNRTETETGRPR